MHYICGQLKLVFWQMWQAVRCWDTDMSCEGKGRWRWFWNPQETWTGEDKLQLEFSCSHRGNPEYWVLGNSEWGRSMSSLPGPNILIMIHQVHRDHLFASFFIYVSVVNPWKTFSLLDKKLQYVGSPCHSTSILLDFCSDTKTQVRI